MSSIHLARFGNKNNAHSVVVHSGVEQQLLSRLLYRSDAPPDSSGLGLEPFVSAYRHEDLYIVQATRTDLAAERPGMVVTEAAILSLPDIANLDLIRLWNALAAADLDLAYPLHADNFRLPSDPARGHVHASGAGVVASALLRDGRVAWIGPGLEECVACLWSHLQYEDRTRLVVSAAAHPGRIPVPTLPDSLSIVVTTKSMVNRWQEWSTCSVGTMVPPDLVRDAMFGDDGGRSNNLAQQLLLTTSTFCLWRLLASAADLLERLADLTHEQCRGLIQLLGVLQPDQERGVEVKAKALHRLRVLTPQASFADIRGLRGLPWSAVSAVGLPPLLDDWVDTVVSDPLRIEDFLDSVVAVRMSNQDGFTDGLSRSLVAGIRCIDMGQVATASVNDQRGEYLLAWLTTADVNIGEIDLAFAAAAQAIEACPRWLATSSRRFSMPRTHALSVDVSDPVAAWTGQLELESRSAFAEDALALRTGLDGVVAAALSVTDQELTTRAAAAVLVDETLLRGSSFSDPRFRDIWFGAVKLGADPWAVVEPSTAVTPLLDLLVAGETVELEILVSLSGTTAADISGYPSRSVVWARLPRGAIAGFKSATAGSFARIYTRGDVAPEQPLQDAILATQLLESVSRESSAQAIGLLEGMPSSQARHAVLVATHGRFNRIEEAALASVVIERRWQAAVEPILRLSTTRRDLQFAAGRVITLLGFWDRARLSIKGGAPLAQKISKFDIGTGLQEVAAELYPNGPKDAGVWTRAGGEEADLSSARTGRLAWGRALQGTLEGRRGSPTPATLVDAMLEDFPRNSKLQSLEALLKKGPDT